MYTAYWRYKDSDEWHKIVSSEPITWNQEIERYQCPILYQGRANHTNHLGSPSTAITGWVLGPITGYGLTFQFSTPGSRNPSTYYTFYLQGATSWSGTIRTRINTPVTLVDLITQGEPDDCGNCVTTFSTGLVITAPECIEVTPNQPECPCCGELIPKATHILSMLG